MYASLLFALLLIIPVSSFTPDKTSFEAYGSKLAANDLLLVKSVPGDASFFLRLAPYNYSLSCTIAYNDSNQYVYTVVVPAQVTSNQSIRFVFIGLNVVTNVPFIGSLTYRGVTGAQFLASMKQTRRILFPCDGWQRDNYRVHHFPNFAGTSGDDGMNNDFFVVTME